MRSISPSPEELYVSAEDPKPEDGWVKVSATRWVRPIGGVDVDQNDVVGMLQDSAVQMLLSARPLLPSYTLHVSPAAVKHMSTDAAAGIAVAVGDAA